MRAVFVLAIAAACGGEQEQSADTAPTWHRDVAPVVDKYCARCHDGSTGLAPGDFSDFSTSSALAEYMLSRIDAGEMPPPASDPDCRPYEGSDRLTVAPADRDLIERWIDAGKPEGDPATAPTAAVVPVDHLTNVTHQLTTAAPYTPQYTDANEYRCFLLDYDEANDKYLTSLEFAIDHPEVSHHAVLYLDNNGSSAGYVTDPATQSWNCEASPDDEWMYLHAWAPGSGPLRFGDGVGLQIGGGQKLVLQMHYYEGAPVTDDRPGYALEMADSVTTTLYYAPVGPYDFVIPAGDKSYTSTERIDLGDLIGTPIPFTVYGGSSHMHVLGKKYDVRYHHPDGTETCIMQGDYDFANQVTYWFDTPAYLPADGGELEVTCTWDNSAGNPDQINASPEDVVWGENTDAEMCFAFLYFSIF